MLFCCHSARLTVHVFPPRLNDVSELSPDIATSSLSSTIDVELDINDVNCCKASKVLLVKSPRFFATAIASQNDDSVATTSASVIDRDSTRIVMRLTMP